MGKFFLKKIFTLHVHIQNDQRVMGIILRYVCWGTHRPPPGGPAADRPTRRPPRFGSTKGGGGVPPPPLRRGVGVPPPPPTAPQTVEHPSGSHIGWRQPPCLPTTTLSSFFDTAFSVRSTLLLFTQLSSLSCAPVPHWGALWCGSSHCIWWYQIQLTLTTSDVRYHTVLWDDGGAGQL